MRLASRGFALTLVSAIALQVGASAAASAQAPSTSDGAAVGAQANAAAGIPTAAAETPAASELSVPAKKTYTVPAGTKVLLQLRSAVNTKSAKPGDGVYLASTFPVVVGNRVMIPSGVYVQGVVDRVVRAGHVKGRAQLDMHFTSIIFPNGSVVEIPGVVSGLPGASKQDVNGEGTIEQDKSKGRNAGRTAEIALPTGPPV